MRPPQAILLPLRQPASFDSQPKATNLAFHGPFCCLCQKSIHGGFGEGIKILILRHFCCLWSWQISEPKTKRQQTDPLEAMSAASVKILILNPTQKAADRPTLSLICCLCQKSILEPKNKNHKFLFPMQLHHHHIVVHSFDHLTKHIRGAKPER